MIPTPTPPLSGNFLRFYIASMTNFFLNFKPSRAILRFGRAFPLVDMPAYSCDEGTSPCAQTIEQSLRQQVVHHENALEADGTKGDASILKRLGKVSCQGNMSEC